MNYKEAKAKAEEIDKGLRSDKHFNTIVSVKHFDGSNMEFWGADIQKESEWVMLFTEHHGCFVYHEEDLKEYSSKSFRDKTTKGNEK